MSYGSWNRRVVVMTEENDGEPLFALREVFYTQDGVPIGHQEPSVMSETMEGLAKLLDRMKEALAQPALKPEDFKEEE
jgi:hypothetical protein